MSGVNTGRVRYSRLLSFELKFYGDLPYGVYKLELKSHDFWTPFDGVFEFSLNVVVCCPAYRMCPVGIPAVSGIDTGRVR
jgi:hypothetical protein